MGEPQTFVVPNFLDGLNLIQHPSQIKDTEGQLLENMEIRPFNLSDTLTYLALTARSTYKRLHTDALLFRPSNLIEFTQSVTGGSGAGTRFLVTGGYKTSTAHFDLRYLKDGDTTTTDIYDAASTDTKRLSFFPFLSKLYYSDGNLAWRSWDGVTDAASVYTTVTKTGCFHKFRAFYGNDVTNLVPNRLYYSSVGLPETVSALQFYDIGAANEPIVALIDFYDRLIIIKEYSTWALFMNPDPALSSVVNMDATKGSNSPLGHQQVGYGAYILTADVGMQNMSKDSYTMYYAPEAIQIYNYLKGFQNTFSAMGWYQDQVFISTFKAVASTYNDATFIYDLLGNKIFKYLINISCFCKNRGLYTFNKKLKAAEYDGTNNYIIELDQVTNSPEATVTAKFRTKEYDLGDPLHRKNIPYIILDCELPDASTALTIKLYGDGTLKETKTFTPTAAGLNRIYQKFKPELSSGNFISLQFEYAQNVNIKPKFALLRMIIGYQSEQRVQ